MLILLFEPKIFPREVFMKFSQSEVL